MKIVVESLLGGAGRASGGVAVIDVFRAFTTAAVVLANGATRIIMVGSVQEAREAWASDMFCVRFSGQTVVTRTAMPTSHDLLAAERFLAAEVRIAACFEQVEGAIAPLLRSMRATGRTTYVTDPERGVIWGHAFLRPPYAPSTEVEWFVGWGLRFPDGGSGWDGADPRLPTVPHAIVAVGASGQPSGPQGVVKVQLPPGWSTVSGEAAFAVASRPLTDLPDQPDAMAAALSRWTVERIEELKSFLANSTAT